MGSQKFDIIVLGATGFTGRLITRYLSTHPQFSQGLFSFSIAARSQSKLHTLVQELSLDPSINTVKVDVTNEFELESVVKSARVVINTVGPFWRWGTPVVRACAKNGVHYVDLTGESVWIKDIIHRYDYLATKTRTIIVPSCGMDSVPSDISAFLSNKTLKAHGQYDVGTSITAHRLRGKFSGGTLDTFITLLEEVPRQKSKESRMDFSLSPINGRLLPIFQFLYNLRIPRERPIVGAFFFMQPANRKLVQRTFGLLEMQAQRVTKEGAPSQVINSAQNERYGPTFGYDEFLVMPSRLSAFIFSAVFAIGFSMLTWVTPFRWLVKKYLPPPGSGPSEEDLPKGLIESTNHTTSTSSPPVHVKSILKGNGDPGYFLSSIMIAESALSMILPPVSVTSAQPGFSKPTSLPADLPSIAHEGGILTPMTAFGDVLVTRLAESGRFQFESYIVNQSGPTEGRKNV